MFLYFLFTFYSLILCGKTLCPNESLEYQDNCFFFKNASVGFALAEIACVEIGGHLCSIHDSFTNTLIAQEGGQIFHESTVTDFWIGLTFTEGNWTWTDGTLLDVTDWARGEPQNVTGSLCGGLSGTDGFWRSDDCFKPKPYVCKVDKAFFDVPTTTTVKTTTTTTIKAATTTSSYPVYANCPYPFTYFQPTHSCYGAGNFTGPLNWTQAEQYCQAFGAHLASIHSHDELMFLSSFIYVGHNNPWTGAFTNDGGNSWKWSDGTPWDYSPFCCGYPNMHANACGVLYGGSVADISCSAVLQPICKKPL